MIFIKSEQQTHSEHLSEQQSEQMKPAWILGANRTNRKNARARVRDFFIFNSSKNIFSYVRVKNSVRSVRFRCLSGFEVFAQVFALLFALGFAVRFTGDDVKNGGVA